MKWSIGIDDVVSLVTEWCTTRVSAIGQRGRRVVECHGRRSSGIPSSDTVKTPVYRYDANGQEPEADVDRREQDRMCQCWTCEPRIPQKAYTRGH